MSVYGELTFCLYVFYPVSSGLSKMVPVSVVLSPLCQTADSAYNKGVEKKKMYYYSDPWSEKCD